MREFEGIPITQEWVDDLVEEWHTGKYRIELLAFIRKNTGWSKEESEVWALTGRLP